ncbi:DUF2955 domain-containing protein [Thiorhodovibrio frisius]|uniref:Putative membrane protein n=1 Tax=Thiorhodovibrio frisius TaxID=631362 RepID=H8YW74_9GAMM|nr:DUF2955 domain-containing protein [Thiorhodovibrio frisius]EIC23865.1 putative membrane protein [Thiorhodovibrio frisius]WPL23225.1 hypothetical protein Thiofri_03410 [Thiorhodovibrio frisius]
MPTEPPTEFRLPEPADDQASARRTWDRRALRLGLGMTLTFVIALAYDWTLAYLAPIFTAPLLQAPRAPTPRAAVGILLVTFLIMALCLVAGGVSQAYPALFLIALFPALFWTFRSGLRGGSSLVMILLLVGLMLVPMVANTTVEITRDVAGSFVGNIGISLAVTLLLFALIPPLPTEPAPAPKPVLPAAEVTRRAWILTAITGSYAVAYFSFGWTNVHTPIYIAIYAFSANLARGLTVTKGILAANVAAGLLTLVMYQLTVMAPHFPFVATMTLAVGLVLARMITSDAPWAPLAGFALSVVMILYGESIIPFSDAGGANFADRLGEIGMAAIYAIAALCVLAAYFPQKQAGFGILPDPSGQHPR